MVFETCVMKIAIAVRAMDLVLLFLDHRMTPMAPFVLIIFIDFRARPFLTMRLIMCLMEVAVAITALSSDNLRHFTFTV